MHFMDENDLDDLTFFFNFTEMEKEEILRFNHNVIKCIHILTVVGLFAMWCFYRLHARENHWFPY